MFFQNRHPVHNPAKGKNGNNNNSNRYNQLLPIRKTSLIKFPVMSNNRNVKSVNNNSNNGKKRCKSYKTYRFLSHPKYKKKTW